MRFAARRHVIPAKRMTNQCIRVPVRRHNERALADERLAILDAQVANYLEQAGTQVRYAVDDGERAIDFVLAAARRAIGESDIPPDGIDFVIYAGVARGWLEPSTASALQHELGVVNATCFDVLDACASWLRALQMAHALIAGGTYRTGLIVNCECDFERYAEWSFERPDEVDVRLAAFTMGEAATATVVTDETPDDDFRFVFKTFGKDHDLCVLPLANAASFAARPLDERCASSKFYSRSRELLSATTRKIIETFEADPVLPRGTYDICFGHGASERASELVARRLGIPLEIYVPTHAQFGNTVAASIPLGMSLALDSGKLKRGARSLIIVGASGITVGLATFTF
jgi:3-oxoacyl-[acyl-carrier-protein] synthase III